MADLISEIGNLRAEFQRVADLDPWVTLAMPPWGKAGMPTIGELVKPSAPQSDPPGKILDGSGRPVPPYKPTLEERAAYCKSVGAVRFSDEHGRERDASIAEVAKFIKYEESWERMLDLYGPPPWVMTPRDFKRCRITAHVDALTWKAERLLLRVLDGPNHIPSDFQEQIRERKKVCEGYGWMRWLQYSVVIHGPHYRIENYPQVAATALFELKEQLILKQPAIPKDEPKLSLSPRTVAIESPALDDYIRGKICRNDRIRTHDELKALLAKGGIRHTHKGQHLYVHAADWHRWNAEQDKLGTEALEAFQGHVVSETNRIRAEKTKKK